MISRRSFLASTTCAGAAAALPSIRESLALSTRPLGDLTSRSATRLAAAIRRREVSAVELVDAFLARIAAINPRLNSVVQVEPDAARAAARVADGRVARRERVGPLHGVPVTIKDSFDTAGMVSTAGTTGRRAFVPARDATAVQRLRAAGAIILGKTNCPELTLSYETDNLIYGRTSNPYDLTRTSGGSSGGAAATLAACGSALDLGSDTGGSIRVPSHQCGTVGLKPTAGRIPRTGHIIGAEGVFQSFTHVGPMARYVEDLALVFPLLAGTDFADAAIVAGTIQPVDAVDLRGLRLAVHSDNGLFSPTPATVTAVTDAAASLAAAGCRLANAVPPALESTSSLGNRLWRAAGSLTVRQLLDAAGTTDVSPPIKPWLATQDPLPAADLIRLLSDLDRARGLMLSFLEGVDAILCPVCAFAAPTHGATMREDLDAAYSYSEVYNYVGWPAVVVRAGSSPEGLPIGVQIVARPWREDVALALAAHLERDLGGWQRPPI
jgi:amidase